MSDSAWACRECGFNTQDLDIFRLLDLSEDHPERKRWQKSAEHRKTLEFYAWFLSRYARANVLDVGSGPGTVAIPVARLAPWHLPFVTGTFDAVILRYALHHFERQGDTLLELHRCLKPGGLLVYSDPAMPPHSRDTTHALYVMREDSFTGYRTYHEIQNMFLRAGFDFMAIRPYLGQRGTFADYLAELPEELKQFRDLLGRGWTGLDEATKAELRWNGTLDGPFITYSVIDAALVKSPEAEAIGRTGA